MRVIAGTYKGRRLFCPKGQSIRPMPDRLKESLFSILQDDVRGARVLDICCGTGAVGIEALSRGAAFTVFIDSLTDAIRALRTNLSMCGKETNYSILFRDALSALHSLDQFNQTFDLGFFDPPYASDIYDPVLEFLGQAKLLEEKAKVIVMHHAKRSLKLTYGSLHRFREVKQGENILSFYRKDDQEAAISP